jgi:hypothetical protein
MEEAESGDVIMPQRISCPNLACPQPSDVHKVSIIVQQGTVQGMLAGSYSIRTQSELSSALAAPPEPQSPRQSGSISNALLYLLPFGFFLGAFSVILIMTTEGIALTNGQGQAAPAGDFVKILLISLGITIFFGLFSYGALVVPAREYRREHSKWVKAKAIWEELYYCNHCDNVFYADDPDPDPDYKPVPASHMKDLLG